MAKVIIQIQNTKLDNVAADFAATHERIEGESDLAFITRVLTEKIKELRRAARKVRLEALAAADSSIDNDMTGTSEVTG